jgi:hypothetical protein
MYVDVDARFLEVSTDECRRIGARTIKSKHMVSRVNKGSLEIEGEGKGGPSLVLRGPQALLCF